MSAGLRRFGLKLTPIRLTEILDEGHAKLLYADSLGFMADHRPVQAEYEAVDAVMDEYLTEQVFYSGLLPPERIDALFAEFIEKLNAAGADRIREEYQRQLDEWMAER